MKHHYTFYKNCSFKYLIILSLLVLSVKAKSQIIELAVGQGTYLYTPDAPYPYSYVDWASWDNSEAPNVGFAEAPNETYAHVGVNSAFSGLQKITCTYVCVGFIRGHVRASPPLHKTYYIKCVGGGSTGGSNPVTEFSEASLPESITLSVGQQFDLSPYIKETATVLTTDPDVASLHTPAMLIGEGPGTCTIGFITATQTYGCKVIVPEPDMALIVWNNSGGASTFKFSEKPKLSMQYNNLVIQTNSANIEYPLVDIERITLINLELDDAPTETSSVEGISLTSSNVEFGNDKIKFVNYPSKTCVSILSPNGMKIDSYIVRDDGTLSIDINKYGKGTYILSSNIANYKFIKK